MNSNIGTDLLGYFIGTAKELAAIKGSPTMTVCMLAEWGASIYFIDQLSEGSILYPVIPIVADTMVRGAHSIAYIAGGRGQIKKDISDRLAEQGKTVDKSVIDHWLSKEEEGVHPPGLIGWARQGFQYVSPFDYSKK